MPANKDHGASRQIFKYNRKPARKVVELLDDKGVEGADRHDKAVAEQLSEFFTLVFTAEIFGDISTLTALFIVDVVEEPDQSEIQEILDQTRKSDVNKTLGQNNVHTRSE